MSKEIRNWLEKARSVYAGYGSSERYEKLSLCIDEVLKLLSQPKDQPISKLTKRIHREFASMFAGTSENIRQSIRNKDLKELCERLDISEASRRELLVACKIGLTKALEISAVAIELGAEITPTHKKHVEQIEAVITNEERINQCQEVQKKSKKK